MLSELGKQLAVTGQAESRGPLACCLVNQADVGMPPHISTRLCDHQEGPVLPLHARRDRQLAATAKAMYLYVAVYHQSFPLVSNIPAFRPLYIYI